jgi:hypothetical protein
LAGCAVVFVVCAPVAATPTAVFVLFFKGRHSGERKAEGVHGTQERSGQRLAPTRMLAQWEWRI